ncbi:MAG: hypothetical protein O2897_05455, partial [bacterium]|nr:hypothetical protein [bacterium]
MNAFISAQGFASDKSWKVTGEHFESLYLSSLQESLKQKNPKELDSSSLNFLKQALVVYYQEAKSGNADAQFRLGVIYEKSNSSQIENAKVWYQLAADQGHKYAKEQLKNNQKKLDHLKCESYGDVFLAIPAYNSELAFHLESLALLGHEDCMLALGKADSLYWLQRAVLTPYSPALQGEALYELGMAQEEQLGHDSKLVISLMERSSRYLFPSAQEWLSEHRNEDGMSAYLSFLKSKKQISFASYLEKNFIQSSATAWNEKERYKAVASETTAIIYARDLAKVLPALQTDNVEQISEVIGSIAEILASDTNLSDSYRNKFIDNVLSLYETLGDKKIDDFKAASSFLRFLTASAGTSIDKEKQLELLSKILPTLSSENLIKLNLEFDAVGFVSSLLQRQDEIMLVEKFLRQIEKTLLVRRALLPVNDLAKIESALRKAVASLGQDEIVLQKILNVAIERNSSDLFLLFFKSLFANELAQLDILIQVEDLLSGVGWGFKEASQASKMVNFLAGDEFKDSSFNGFPKLKLWRDSAFVLEKLDLGFHNGLFSDAILTLQAYAQSAKNYQESGTYFIGHELAATLSSKHIDAVKSGFETRVNRLSELRQDFKQNRHDKDYVEDAQVSQNLFKESVKNNLVLKKHQLKQYVLELLATQETLNTQLSYAGLHGERKAALVTSDGLKIFNKVAGESDDFTVSPADAKISPRLISLDNSFGFSHHSVELNKNDVLNIQVAGEWSPTCALKQSGMVKNADGVLIGSEGFRVHMTSGDNIVVGNDARTSSSEFTSHSASQGGSIDWAKAAGLIIGAIAGGAPGGPPGALAGAGIGAIVTSPFSFYNSYQDTTGTSTTSEKSEYQQTSAFESNTAAFQSGIRLAHTPYPQLTAGAYLAVVVSREPGNLGQVVKQLVLQSHNSYVAAQNSQVFFVVNDCNDGSGDKGMLAVHTQK